MNITTGINNFKTKIETQKAKVKSINKWMQLPLVIVFSATLGACAPQQQSSEKTAKSDVKISSPIICPANRQICFQCITRYMQTNDIRSQITGTITQVNCTVAGNITVNQSLFTIQPQEAAALQKSKFHNPILNGLSDTVFSHQNGQLKNLNVQIGDFVQAGDILASCIRTNSMRVIAYIPVEQVSKIEKIKDCLVFLPDGSTVNGQISGKLPTAETQDQTVAYIVDIKTAISLAENINLTVQFNTEQIQNAVFVPGSAVLGNEEQTCFWIMKLVNDSTCIKVPIEKGIKKDSLIQLIGSNLTINDRIISEGGYGLPDSARIQTNSKK